MIVKRLAFPFFPKSFKRMYNSMMEYTEKKHSQTALFFLALSESIFFPIYPDILLTGMGVKNPSKAIRFAAICTIGSLIGGVIGYAIGFSIWINVKDVFFTYLHPLGFSEEAFNRIKEAFKENAFITVFTAGFTPIPYKVFTIASGVAHISFVQFVLASLLSRGLRFFIIGFLLLLFGKRVQIFIEKYFEILTISIAIIFILGIYFLFNI